MSAIDEVSFPSEFSYLIALNFMMGSLIFSRFCLFQKKVYHKLKHDLENWRELIVIGDSVFKWEKMYFAGVIWGSLTLYYLVLWYMDFSILTFLSLVGLFLVLADYLYPMIGKLIFKPENWSGEHENKYESICKSVVSLWFKWKEGQEAFFSAKEQRSAVVSNCFVLLFCFVNDHAFKDTH